jgi:hypothetical protein
MCRRISCGFQFISLCFAAAASRASWIAASGRPFHNGEVRVRAVAGCAFLFEHVALKASRNSVEDGVDLDHPYSGTPLPRLPEQQTCRFGKLSI